MDNKITFGTRYDLSDKAKLFSLPQRFKIKRMVSKLGKNDVVCIGTRKYKTYGAYNTVTLREARVDAILDGKKDTFCLEDKNFGMNAYHSLPSKDRQKVMKERSYKFVTEVLERLQAKKSPNPKPLPNNFLARMDRFDAMHDTKLEVRQWSRMKQTFGHDKFIPRMREKMYEIKDMFTDMFEAIVTGF